MIRRLYRALPGPAALRVAIVALAAAAALALLLAAYEWAGAAFVDSGGLMG